MAKKFKQFVTDKDKDKAPVKKIADYVGDIPNAPPSGGAPYAATGKGGKAKKGAKVGDDWGDQGDKKLIYKPDIDQDMSDKKGIAKCVDSVKEFVDHTKNLTPAEFAKYLAKNNKNSGIVHESIHNTCQALNKNPDGTADLVRELKRSGLLKRTVIECLLHQEGYDAIAEVMGNKNGESVCRRLVKAMNEMVGPPMHHGMNPRGNQHHGMLNMGDEGMMGNPNMGGMPQHGPEDPNHPFDDDMNDEDDFGLDDEDDDGMGDPTQGASDPNAIPSMMGDPTQGLGAGVNLQRQRINTPRLSMMSRMMNREDVSPATNNFLKAIRN